ncbi:hypothetical protein FBZ83_11957 [Azospirillum brasilense]|uniref:Uncharacterized protein n=1 Tax=Azospirillum brasilense TaxID=192 RepID=A0A560BUX2_AZOBR|nr:hypothetical protein FBZ83_11957 [Azospirillum brasilense]
MAERQAVVRGVLRLFRPPSRAPSVVGPAPDDPSRRYSAAIASGV